GNDNVRDARPAAGWSAGRQNDFSVVSRGVVNGVDELLRACSSMGRIAGTGLCAWYSREEALVHHHVDDVARDADLRTLAGRTERSISEVNDDAVAGRALTLGACVELNIHGLIGGGKRSRARRVARIEVERDDQIGRQR